MAKASAITGYCMSTKQKNVPMKNVIINKHGNRYVAKGDDGKGHNMAVIMNAEKANKAIEDGLAKKGEGWDTKKKK